MSQATSNTSASAGAPITPVQLSFGTETVNVTYAGPTDDQREKVIEVCIDRPVDQVSPDLITKIHTHIRSFTAGHSVWDSYTIRIVHNAPQPVPA